MLARLHHVCVGSAFDGWVSAIELQRDEQERIRHEQAVIKRAILRMQSIAMSFAFDGWYTGAFEHRRLTRVAGIVIARLVHALLSRCLVSWCDYVSSARRVKQFMLRASQRMHGQTLAFVWQAWRDFHYSSIQQSLEAVKHQALMDAAARMALHWSKRRLSKCFRRWCEHCHNAARLKRVLRHTLQKMRLSTVSRCFEAWFQDLKASILKRNLMRRGLQWLKNRVVAAAFFAWTERTQERLMSEERMQKLLRRWSNAGAARVFDRWRLYWEQIAKARYCMRRVQHRVTWLCINRWRDLVEIEARHRFVQTKVVLRLKQLRLASVWDQWSLLAWRRSQLRTMLSRIRLSQLHRAMDGWKHALQILVVEDIRLSREQEIAVIHRIYSNQILNLEGYVGVRWQRKMLLRAWFVWRLRARHRNQMLAQGGRFIHFLARRDSALIVSSCFYLWLRQYHVGTWTKYYADYSESALLELEPEPAPAPEPEPEPEDDEYEEAQDEGDGTVTVTVTVPRSPRTHSAVWLQQALSEAKGLLDQAASIKPQPQSTRRETEDSRLLQERAMRVLERSQEISRQQDRALRVLEQMQEEGPAAGNMPPAVATPSGERRYLGSEVGSRGEFGAPSGAAAEMWEATLGHSSAAADAYPGRYR